MKRIRFVGAVSLDGYLAGPNGEADWIVADPEMNFPALIAQFDTLLVGRRTFDTMVRAKRTTMPGMRTVVLSTTLRAADYPGLMVINDSADAAVRALRDQSGKDIWLFGGGECLRRLLDAGLVDRIELAVQPVLLGGGIPLLAGARSRHRLQLSAQRVSRVGVVHLDYAIERAAS